jgi:steroid delta-isomerase-like uncharacterized protein
MADNKALVHRWFEEVWNQGREQTIDELLGANIIAFGLGESETAIHSLEEFKETFRNLRNAFPDIHINVEDTLAEHDKVAVRILIEGTHKGDALGVPATGKRVHLSGICIIQLAAGKLVAGWNSWDQLGMFQQLGVVPKSRAFEFKKAG